MLCPALPANREPGNGGCGSDGFPTRPITPQGTSEEWQSVKGLVARTRRYPYVMANGCCGAASPAAWQGPADGLIPLLIVHTRGPFRWREGSSRVQQRLRCQSMEGSIVFDPEVASQRRQRKGLGRLNHRPAESLTATGRVGLREPQVKEEKGLDRKKGQHKPVRPLEPCAVPGRAIPRTSSPLVRVLRRQGLFLRLWRYLSIGDCL